MKPELAEREVTRQGPVGRRPERPRRARAEGGSSDTPTPAEADIGRGGVDKECSSSSRSEHTWAGQRIDGRVRSGRASDPAACPTEVRRCPSTRGAGRGPISSRPAVAWRLASAAENDLPGRSGTSLGRLVHPFQHAKRLQGDPLAGFPGLLEGESRHLLHVGLGRSSLRVRMNPL